jgi:hypothetical protein
MRLRTTECEDPIIPKVTSVNYITLHHFHVCRRAEMRELEDWFIIVKLCCFRFRNFGLIVSLFAYAINTRSDFWDIIL